MEQSTSEATGRPGQTQHIVLPKTLEQIPTATELPCLRHRWNSNEEIASWLISFDCHEKWLSSSTKNRPQSGSMILYNRKKVRFRRDGYFWKKRKNERTTRVDHMKLKIHGVECIYGSYVHSALIPTFHRRSYWLLQNPDIVLVHYLNIPSMSEDCSKSSHAMKASSILPTSLPTPQSQLDIRGYKGTVWQREELLQQIKPMFSGTQVQLNGNSLTSESDVANIVVQYLLDLQDQQNSKTDQHPIVFSALMEKASTSIGKACSSVGGASSSAPSPQSVSSIPPSPMSVQSEPPTLPTSTAQTFLQQGTDRSPAGMRDVGVIAAPLPVLLFNTFNEVDSSGGVLGSATLVGYPIAQGSVSVSGAPVSSMGTCQATSGSVIGQSGCSNDQTVRDVSGRPLITDEESAELRAMVDNDPSLKTCRNRFENQPGVHQKTVLLPPYLPSPARSEPSRDVAAEASLPQGDPSRLPSYDAHVQRQRSIERSTTTPAVMEPSSQSADVSLTLGGSAQQASNQASLFQPVQPQTPLFPNYPESLPANTPHLPPPPPYTLAANTVIASTVFTLAPAASDHSQAQQPPTTDSKQPSSMSISIAQPTGLGQPTTVSIPASTGLFSGASLPGVDAIQSSLLKTEKPLVFKPLAQPLHRVIPVGGGIANPQPVTTSQLSQSQVSFPFVNQQQQSSTVNQPRPVLPNGNDFSIPDLDIELDFDAEMFDSALADITLDSSLRGSTPVPNGSQQPAVSDRLTGQRLTNGTGSHSEGLMALQQGTSLPDQCLQAITEFSPDWSYPEGGVKILVTGPWHSTTASYQCMFDNYGVPASLVQTGVLRCYCPAHEAGVIALQVLCDGVVISKSSIFEYKARSAQQRPNRQHEWLSLDENQFHVAILDRLEHIERRILLSKSQSSGGKQGSSGGPSDLSLSFEDRVVALCQRFMSGQWAPNSSSHLGAEPSSQRGMTLLHLAAALGYSKLISTLVTWRNEQHSLILEMEVDPLNIDHFSCTPLMWAAALGHKETAMLLFIWSPQALHVCDSLGRLPIDMAKSRGHTSLAESLQRLEFDGPGPALTPPSLSTPPISIPQLGVGATPGDRIPAFMLSSPSTATPCSSTTPRSPLEPASPFDSPSPSSGCLSQLSASPASQGFLSPASFKAHSPRGALAPGTCPSGQPTFGTSLKPSSALYGTYGAYGDTMDCDGSQERGRRSSRGQEVKGSHMLDVQQLLRGIENIQRHNDVGCLSEQEREDLKRHAERLRKLGAQMGVGTDPNPGHTPGDAQPHSQGQLRGSSYGQIAGQAIGQAIGHTFQAGGGHHPCHAQDHTQSHAHGYAPGMPLEVRCDSPMQTDSMMGGEGGELPGLPAPFSWITEPNQKEQYLNLAEQILNALPARIKDSIKFPQGSELGDDFAAMSPSLGSVGGHGMDMSGDQESHRSAHDESSAGSTYSTDSCLPSPSNLSFEEESSTADWCDFLQGASHTLGMVGAFSLLTLSDEEQMQLYQAALVIQNAFRQYKGRQQQKQQELEAAVIIQNYYRRYKQYMMYSKMSEAAKVIQSRFRSYNHYRQFQRSRRAAIVIQSHYRGYRAQEQFRKSRDAAIVIQQRFRDKRLARQKIQQDAARKIQRFIRRCQNRLRSLRQTRADVKRFSCKKD